MKKNAFTLIELLIYVGIFAVIAGLVVDILLIMTRVNQRESASTEVTGQLNFVMQRLQQLVRESSNIEISTGITTSTLKLRMKDLAKDPTCLYLVSGVIKLAEGPDAINANNCTSNISDLTSDRVIVNAFNLQKFTQYPGHDTLSIDMQMTYNSNNPQSKVQRNLQSAIARVSAATFDSDVVPGGTYNFNLGQIGAPWQKIIMSDGSSANPSYTFSNNTGLGLFRAGADILGFSAAGSERMRIDANGNVYVGQGRVIIGDIGSFPPSTFDTGRTNPDPGNTLILSGANRDLALVSMDTSDGAKADIDFFRAKGSPSSPANVLSTTQLGLINWRGYYGGSFTPRIATMGVTMDGTPGVNDYPTRFEFLTTPDGSSVGQIRMVIKNNGNVGIGTTNPSARLEVNGNVMVDSGGLENRAVCWKPDGKTLGYCSSVVNAAGVCTCN